MLMYVTDRPQALPEGAQLLAVGAPIANVGFAGLNIENGESGPVWRALIKNNAAQIQRRTWWMEARRKPLSSAQEITLQPGECRELAGQFPAGESSCELVLEADAFPLDDRLPMLQPQPKALSVAIEENSAFKEFFEKFVTSIENATRVGSGADVEIMSADPKLPCASWPRALVFSRDSQERMQFLPGQIVAENQPLMADLNWQALRCRDTSHFAMGEQDQALLWQGDRPLIFLTAPGLAQSLVVNFDLAQSNATRLPSFVLLLHRFVESIRATKVFPEAKNVETNQLLTVAADLLGPAAVLVPASEEGVALRAPAAPGFFSVQQGERTLLTAAAHFADAREADFSAATAADSLTGQVARLADRSSVHDFLAPLWTILLAATLLANWAWIARSG